MLKMNFEGTRKMKITTGEIPAAVIFIIDEKLSFNVAQQKLNLCPICHIIVIVLFSRLLWKASSMIRITLRASSGLTARGPLPWMASCRLMK